MEYPCIRSGRDIMDKAFYTELLMTDRTALIWILGGLAAMLLLGRRRSDAPAIGGTGGEKKPSEIRRPV